MPFEAEEKGLTREVKWVFFDESPSSEKVTNPERVLEDIDRVVSGESSNVRSLVVRDPVTFKAGELRHHINLWERILEGYRQKTDVLEWISSGVNIRKFMKPFKGVFKNVAYDSPSPPKKVFKNHPSCEPFSSFISDSLSQRIESGAVRVWGRVGEVSPPWLVLPLTVEPQKPRLCIDARFLNLWMADTPFSLDTLAMVPRFVYRGSFMTTIDDKSGYDHILLSEDSHQFFGIEWQGWWLVGVTLPFGWKIPLAFTKRWDLVQRISSGVGGLCSLYIDDRLNGELFTSEGYWSRPISQRNREFSFQAAVAALFIVVKVLVHLGYFLGLKKCVLIPVTRIVYLGMIVESLVQAFSVPKEKRDRFAQLREGILVRKSSVPLKSIQRLMGKCISFSLAFPGAKFYIREMAASLAISLSTDASLFRWAAVIHLRSSDLSIGDYLEDEMKNKHINVKEMYAVAKALESLPLDVKHCRVDIQVDSQVVIHAWSGRGSRSRDLTELAKRIFQFVTQRNLSVSMSYVPSGSNPADWFSRKLSNSDAMLSQRCWELLQLEFGGHEGHNLDLMSLDSNTQRDKCGNRLRHFTPYPTPDSSGVNVFNQNLSVCDGVNVNASVFPPFSLISPLLHFLQTERAIVTVVVPKRSPLPSWWPMINAMVQRKVLLAKQGSPNAVLFPTKQGFKPGPLSWDLYAFRLGGIY